MATVSGNVEKIKYRNEENGYSILSVNSDGLDYVLVGTFPYISEGDFIEASGRDVEHPIYGDQIQVESYELKAPEDTASMERYLGSGAIRGVGTALAARIVRRFKADTIACTSGAKIGFFFGKRFRTLIRKHFETDIVGRTGGWNCKRPYKPESGYIYL